MNIHTSKRLFVVAAVLATLALFAAAFFVAPTLRSVVAGPSASPDAPNPGHAWTDIQGHGDDADACYVSTESDQAFEVRVNGDRALRLEPDATSPNVIGGYSGNSVSDGAYGATIGGGGESGWTNRVTDDYGTVGGGKDNLAGDNAGTTSDAFYATVGGGAFNSATDFSATVAGGENNTAGGPYATVGGGQYNTASSADSPTVAGGKGNTASGGVATVGGGDGNSAGANYATVGGGRGNSASSTSSTVGGGPHNVASAASATVGGGSYNEAAADYATIAGGGDNNPANGNRVTGAYGTVGGGINNASADNATVGGGVGNSASGSVATVPGGIHNTAAGAYSFAAGRLAKANNQGCFVWGDSTMAEVACNTNDRFIARANGGVYLYSKSDLSTGVYMDNGDNDWTGVSDRNLKENFSPVDGQEVLASLAEMPITAWNLKGQDPSNRHIGPMAQDFYAAFGLSADDLYISPIDTDGVALPAIQGLYEIVQDQDARIDALEARVAALEGEATTSGGLTGPLSSVMPFGPLLLAGLVVGGLALVQRRRAGGRR